MFFVRVPSSRIEFAALHGPCIGKEVPGSKGDGRPSEPSARTNRITYVGKKRTGATLPGQIWKIAAHVDRDRPVSAAGAGNKRGTGVRSLCQRWDQLLIHQTKLNTSQAKHCKFVMCTSPKCPTSDVKHAPGLITMIDLQPKFGWLID